MVFPFARNCFGARPRTPGESTDFRERELKTERVAIASRLLFAYAFVRPKYDKIAHIYRLAVTGSIFGGRSQRGSHLQLWLERAISRAGKHYKINTIDDLEKATKYEELALNICRPVYP